MTQKERMEKGLVYDATVNDIMSEQVTYLDAMYRFNLTAPTELEKKRGSFERNARQRRRGMLYRAAVPRKLGRKECAFREFRVCEFQSYRG